MAYDSTPRETLRIVADLVPDKYLMDAIVALEDFLEPNEETQQVIDDAIHGRNLIGPFYDVKEMHAALLSDKTDEELIRECEMREKERKKIKNDIRS